MRIPQPDFVFIDTYSEDHCAWRDRDRSASGLMQLPVETRQRPLAFVSLMQPDQALWIAKFDRLKESPE